MDSTKSYPAMGSRKTVKQEGSEGKEVRSWSWYVQGEPETELGEGPRDRVDRARSYPANKLIAPRKGSATPKGGQRGSLQMGKRSSRSPKRSDPPQKRRLQGVVFLEDGGQQLQQTWRCRPFGRGAGKRQMATKKFRRMRRPGGKTSRQRLPKNTVGGMRDTDVYEKKKFVVTAQVREKGEKIQKAKGRVSSAQRSISR